MANNDKAWTLTGTGSFVEQDFGFWSDSQAVVVSGAAGDISFDGTNAIPMSPSAATGALAFSDHRRRHIYVRGVGATFLVIATEGAEV